MVISGAQGGFHPDSVGVKTQPTIANPHTIVLEHLFALASAFTGPAAFSHCQIQARANP
jgi:hypothetical protein